MSTKPDDPRLSTAGTEPDTATDRILATHGKGSHVGMPDPAMREKQKALELNNIGQRQPRLDGHDKVSGRSMFTDDIRLPGMLYGKILRSRHAHARITRIDTSKALALPGVKAVVTGEESQKVFVNQWEPAICLGETRYIGEEIAAVAAVDEFTAEEALELIEVDYEPLPSVPNLKKALRPTAPQINPFHQGNVASENQDDYGDPDKALAEADLILENKFSSHPTHNCYSEFHAVLVDWSFPDKLTMYTPTQSGYLFQNKLCEAFGLSISQVRIVHLNTGGAFTGRGLMRPHHFIAAMLSRKACRPVKILGWR